MSLKQGEKSRRTRWRWEKRYTVFCLYKTTSFPRDSLVTKKQQKKEEKKRNSCTENAAMLARAQIKNVNGNEWMLPFSQYRAIRRRGLFAFFYRKNKRVENRKNSKKKPLRKNCKNIKILFKLTNERKN